MIPGKQPVPRGGVKEARNDFGAKNKNVDLTFRPWCWCQLSWGFGFVFSLFSFEHFLFDILKNFSTKLNIFPITKLISIVKCSHNVGKNKDKNLNHLLTLHLKISTANELMFIPRLCLFIYRYKHGYICLERCNHSTHISLQQLFNLMMCHGQYISFYNKRCT